MYTLYTTSNRKCIHMKAEQKTSTSNKKSTVVTLRLPNELVARVDAKAEEKGVKRGEVLREQIVELYGAAESS
jgi:predicted DNA binding CopG/RHH family protein